MASKIDNKKNLSSGVLKNICSDKVLQVIINAPAVLFTFSILLCFQRILLNTFRQMRLNHESYSLKYFLFYAFKQHSGNCLKLQSLIAKTFRWKLVENESRKFYAGNNEQKSMFPVIYQSDMLFRFACLFFSCLITISIKKFLFAK